jgi:hypothetical protein
VRTVSVWARDAAFMLRLFRIAQCQRRVSFRAWKKFACEFSQSLGDLNDLRWCCVCCGSGVRFMRVETNPQIETVLVVYCLRKFVRRGGHALSK